MCMFRSESGVLWANTQVLFSDPHQCKLILQTGVMILQLMYNKRKKLVFTSNTENVFFIELGSHFI